MGPIPIFLKESFSLWGKLAKEVGNVANPNGHIFPQMDSLELSSK
jgi:hypothetical protein